MVGAGSPFAIACLQLLAALFFSISLMSITVLFPAHPIFGNTFA